MRFAYIPVASLPPLAWHAELRRGDPVVRVHHGAWVETREQGFVEGAWELPFAELRFDEATCFAGTGARLADGAVLFATSTDREHRLQSLRRRDSLRFSNSLVFLLQRAGDAPDPWHPFYMQDVLAHLRSGVRAGPHPLRTRRRSDVSLHYCANLRVSGDLALRREEKRSQPAPLDYPGYVGMLRGAIDAVIHNAADPRRAQRYSPLATLSRGYDANAVAALARESGCSEAVTFCDETLVPAHEFDSGRPIGEALGYRVREFHKRDLQRSTALPEVEFCVSPPGNDASLFVLGDALRGRLLLTGNFGDDILTTDRKRLVPDMIQLTRAGSGGCTSDEFRLRIGYLSFAPLYLAARHNLVVHAISTSAALRPWSLGQRYDRPIPRRILEEAGIPREWFGRSKIAGAFYDPRRISRMSPTSRRSYLRYFRSRPQLQLCRFAQRLRGRRVPLNAFTFHWGFHHVRDRYEIGPGDALPERAPRDPHAAGHAAAVNAPAGAGIAPLGAPPSAPGG